jgi:hypothetical protein
MNKVTFYLMFLMTVVCAAYLTWLAAIWNQYQADRLSRNDKINELLDRFPRRSPVTEDDTS